MGMKHLKIILLFSGGYHFMYRVYSCQAPC